MTAYGTFLGSPGAMPTCGASVRALAYSLLLIAVEYGCFSLIMEVADPYGASVFDAPPKGYLVWT